MEKRYGAHGAQLCKALEVLCNSAALQSLASKQRREENNPKKHSAPCFSPRSRRTETQSNPPLCMVVKLNYEAANAFSAADKKVRLFISKEHFLSIPPSSPRDSAQRC